MAGFRQKYTIVQFSEELPRGYEYSMKEWPLHVTLADVFAISGDWAGLLKDLRLHLDEQTTLFSKVVANDLFGKDRSVKVKLIQNTAELQSLHERIIDVLESLGVVFNTPQYTRAGFKPHSTEQKTSSLQIGDVVEFNSVTLIDMFPDGDPYRRRVLGTVKFS